jgi:glycerol-3-phosphate cytidylyltransferase-like family protein
MHARSCECAVCEAGIRPTESQREAAVRAAVRADVDAKKKEKSLIAAEETRARVAATNRVIEAVRVVLPSEDEQDEMRRMAREFRR